MTEGRRSPLSGKDPYKGGTSASDGLPLRRIATVITIDPSVSGFGRKSVGERSGCPAGRRPRLNLESCLKSCARSELENLLKQQVLDGEADKGSTHFLESNPPRLWQANFA